MIAPPPEKRAASRRPKITVLVMKDSEKSEGGPQAAGDGELGCLSEKAKYESCWHNWYQTKALAGDFSGNCENLFNEYQKCLKAGLEQKGLITHVSLPPRTESARDALGQR